MKKIGFSICLSMIVGACLSATAGTYDTKFTSGGSLATTYTSGGFTATFSGVSLSTYPVYNILNIGAGVLELNFSEPVSSISFDLGGIDHSWDDKVVFDIAPSLSAPVSTATDIYRDFPDVNGDALYSASDYGLGARVTFAGLPDVTSFTWTDAGTAGSSDWTFYDNFSFTTAGAVPEPSTLALSAISMLGGLAAFRRRK